MKNIKFKVLEGLETLTNLRELYAGKNKITKIDGLQTLTNLIILSIQVKKLIKKDLKPNFLMFFLNLNLIF